MEIIAPLGLILCVVSKKLGRLNSDYSVFVFVSLCVSVDLMISNDYYVLLVCIAFMYSFMTVQWSIFHVYQNGSPSQLKRGKGDCQSL